MGFSNGRVSVFLFSLYWIIDLTAFCIIFEHIIASWITENNEKLPKIDSKQGCLLAFWYQSKTGFNHWLFVWHPTNKQPSQAQTCIHGMAWHIYCLSSCEVKCGFLFLLRSASKDQSRREMAIIYRWCCCKISFITSFVLGWYIFTAATWSLKWNSLNNILVWIFIYPSTIWK